MGVNRRDGAAPGSHRTVAIAFHEPIIGGSAVGVLRVLAALEARGWRFVFWTPGPGPLRDELVRRGYDVEGEPRLVRYSLAALRLPPGPLRRLASVPGYLWRFRRWVRRQAPAVLQANTLISIPEAIVGRRRGTGVLVYVHEILPRGPRGWVAGAALRAAADAVFTNSTASLGALRRARVDAAMAAYGIELPAVPAPRGPATGRPLVVGTLGTVSRRKGSDVFVAVAERILAERADVEFRLVGPHADGRDQAWGRDLTEHAGRVGVRWSTTSTPFEELAGWDVLMLPTREEAFGLVLLEAMAMCLPVVASRIQGPGEIVTPQTGVLVEPDDVEGFAEAVRRLLDDPAARDRLGRAGRVRVEAEYTVERQAEALDRAYRRAAARRAPAG